MTKNVGFYAFVSHQPSSLHSLTAAGRQSSQSLQRKTFSPQRHRDTEAQRFILFARSGDADRAKPICPSSGADFMHSFRSLRSNRLCLYSVII